MKKVNERYVLSNTDRARIESHTRAIARQADYTGTVEAWFDCSTGTTHYHECVGSSYMVSQEDDMEHIYTAYCCANI